MEGVFEKYNLPVGERIKNGNATISAFELTDMKHDLSNLRAMMNGGSMFRAHDGKYIRLVVDGELMMSDTHMERLSNSQFVDAAHGKVMIAGLGIGLIIFALHNKVESGLVTEITIIEKYQSVIDLVKPVLDEHFSCIKYVCADILAYKPVKDEMYDTVYFDIWPSICSENYTEMKVLKRTWVKNLSDNNPYIDAWMQKSCKQLYREECYSSSFKNEETERFKNLCNSLK